MSKRILWAGGAMAILVVAGFGWMRWHERPEWTTSSPAALAELEAGIAANRKMYVVDARKHFEEALKLDPDFIAAKMQLAFTGAKPKEERDKLIADLRAADLDRVTPRERFLVRYYLARHDDRGDEAQGLLETYMKAHPDDPYALDIAARQAWNHQELDRALKLYGRILAVSPNDALAYNNLGYTAMQRGEFAKAEQYLTTYRFIAPDQANPHDSLGELYALTGRYDDATRELEAAIAVRSDFFTTYDHLISVKLLQGDVEGASATVDRAAAAGAPERQLHGERCAVAAWRALAEGWKAVAKVTEGECSDVYEGVVPILAFRAALVLGNADVATKYEELMRKGAEMAQQHDMMNTAAAGLAHFEGTRLLAEGKPAEAAARFREADSELAYLGIGPGSFKLFNRLALVVALKRAGKDDEAQAALAEVRAVNPDLARRFEGGDIAMLAKP